MKARIVARRVTIETKEVVIQLADADAEEIASWPQSMRTSWAHLQIAGNASPWLPLEVMGGGGDPGITVKMQMEGDEQ